MDIERFRLYYRTNQVFLTKHAIQRIHERGIRMKEIREAVKHGEIVEEYPDDFPFPSCLILGFSDAGRRPIHVVMSDEGTASRLITAYIPSEQYWLEDFKTRKG